MDYDKQHVEELVENAKNGDSESFGKVYDIFVDAIYRYVFYRVRSDEVEDMVEIVFLRAWEHLPKYKKGAYQFSSWLFRIAHNLIVDFYRDRSKNDVLHVEEEEKERVPDTSRESMPALKAEVKLNNAILREALAKLPRPYHDVVVFKFINDFSNEEIARILGKSETSVRVIQFRALKELKKILSYYDL